jgi:hypothetical protein
MLRQCGPEHELQIPAACEIASASGIKRRFDRLQVEPGADLRVPERLFALLQRE